ncbi:unnamed protein product [Lathyrus oleraceus]
MSIATHLIMILIHIDIPNKQCESCCKEQTITKSAAKYYKVQNAAKVSKCKPHRSYIKSASQQHANLKHNAIPTAVQASNIKTPVIQVQTAAEPRLQTSRIQARSKTQVQARNAAGQNVIEAQVQVQSKLANAVKPNGKMTLMQKRIQGA